RSPRRPVTGIDTAPASSVTVTTQEALDALVPSMRGISPTNGTTSVCMSAATIPAAARTPTTAPGRTAGSDRFTGLPRSSAGPGVPVAVRARAVTPRTAPWTAPWTARTRRAGLGRPALRTRPRRREPVHHTYDAGRAPSRYDAHLTGSRTPCRTSRRGSGRAAGHRSETGLAAPAMSHPRQCHIRRGTRVVSAWEHSRSGLAPRPAAPPATPMATRRAAAPDTAPDTTDRKSGV